MTAHDLAVLLHCGAMVGVMAIGFTNRPIRERTRFGVFLLYLFTMGLVALTM